ncbi:hypothetical protein IHE44_0014949 [Lamprotornis superbus]|uniref:Transcription initiation factor IIB n=1 Tax=Lamprotornis superbus TaxID=245042 RepID=A0A835P1G0_9PASS|nr:hypothetical protein IHE44_0014949 [Lamprotornis superbus]
MIIHGLDVLPRVTCPNHPDSILVEDYRAGDMICSECGLVVGDRVIDVGSEWRTFSNDKATKDPSRVGDTQNPLLSDGDLSTMIGKGTGAASFDEFGNSKYQNRRTMSSSDRAMMNAFKEITNMADRINLPRNIVDRTNNLFKQVYEQKSLKGRSNDAIASACLYIACRQEGVPRTFKEICAVSRISKKEIGRCFKLILKALETSVDLITTGDFMSRFCSNLGLPKQVQMAATHIARKAVELDLVPGRSPISVAAAAIYMASQASSEKRTQKEIGDIAGVADVTIRQSYRLIYPRAPDLFPADFKFDTPVDKLPQLMYKVLILGLRVVELEDMEMEHNCWKAAYIPRVSVKFLACQPTLQSGWPVVIRKCGNGTYFSVNKQQRLYSLLTQQELLVPAMKDSGAHSHKQFLYLPGCGDGSNCAAHR